ncbi:MAG TPA: hypothetical protein VJN48_06885, partial [Terriglobales bacterium]|nr:hypothetical protein [Terriglobales bacterium]
MFTRVLFCPPTYFEVREVKNPYMRGLLQVDRVRAQHQWDNLCEAFRSVGYTVELIDPVTGPGPGGRRHVAARRVHPAALPGAG